MCIGKYIGAMSKFSTKKNACQEVPFLCKILKKGYMSVSDPSNRQLKMKNHALLLNSMFLW